MNLSIYIYNVGANRRMSGSLASTARQLERNITSDKIDRHLHKRPDVEDLEKLHVLQSKISPQLQEAQLNLQRNMSSDVLSHLLGTRPDADELRLQGVLRGINYKHKTNFRSCYYMFLNNFIIGTNVAAGLQATQEKLQRQLNTDQVHQKLEHRPSKGELAQRGLMDGIICIYSLICLIVIKDTFYFILENQIAPSLLATAKALERNIVQDQVSLLLETRPPVEDLLNNHIVDGIFIFTFFISNPYF